MLDLDDLEETLEKEYHNAGFTQTAFAKKIGVSIETVRRWQEGVTEPSPENQKKIKEVLEGE